MKCVWITAFEIVPLLLSQYTLTNLPKLEESEFEDVPVRMSEMKFVRNVIDILVLW